MSTVHPTEVGPELIEFTHAAKRVPPSVDALVTQIRAVRAEVAALREDNARGLHALMLSVAR